MNKLAVVVPFYKRHRLTKLCFDRLKEQSKRLGFDVIVAGSEGEKSKKLANGFKYIEADNKPLGNKLNTLIKECKSYDGVIIIGSDNFMSDSIIEMYQQIDCSKDVFYSFNDIFIYSARLDLVRSDFEYTRSGHSIGVARLYTKPTIEKMNYEIWDKNRLKGLDGSANRRLKAKGIKEIVLDLDNHLLIDVKIEENITSHEIINTGYKEHNVDVFKKLGKIGDEILSLKPKGRERIYSKYELSGSEEIPMFKAKVLKDFNQYKTGDIAYFKKHTITGLRRAGFIILLGE